MVQNKYFTQTYKVLECGCDANRCITPGAFMRLAQQISTDHCDSIGLTDGFYAENHAVFLMAKQAIKWNRIPKAGETLTLRTMPENANRAVYKRVTTACDATGQCIGMLDSRWVLVDTDTRRILRRAPAAFQALPFEQAVPFTLSVAIEKPPVCRPASKCCASFTRCDRNGHMNNTRYADVALDAIPLQALQGRAVSEMILSYHHELPLGRECELEQGRIQPDRWYVAGHTSEHCCFEANIGLCQL